MTSDWIKTPWIEDLQRCEKGQHLWLIMKGHKIHCFSCGIERKENKKCV